MNIEKTVTVRKLKAQDKQHWLALWGKYLKFYRANVAADTTDETYKRLCECDDFLGLVAADSDDNIVGFMNIIYHSSTWSKNGYCYIEDLFVDKSLRGEGVAEFLFDKAEELATEKGCDRIYWMTQEFNAPARSLYDKIGKRSSFIIYMRK